MSPCCQTPYLARIEKIKENRSAEPAQKIRQQTAETAPPAAPAPQHSLASAAQTQTPAAPTLPRDEMTPVVRPAGSPASAMQTTVPFMPTLPRDEMTPVVQPTAPPEGIRNVTPGMNPPAANPGGTPLIEPTDGVFENPPTFQVPANPLLPPGYQEILDYNSLQYLNGFYRTQIGRYVRADQQVSSNEIETRYGFLIGVGINYLLMQDLTTGNVFTIDTYSIKFFYVYYHAPMELASLISNLPPEGIAIPPGRQ